jgi:hypothetical protein
MDRRPTKWIWGPAHGSGGREKFTRLRIRRRIIVMGTADSQHRGIDDRGRGPIGFASIGQSVNRYRTALQLRLTCSWNFAPQDHELVRSAVAGSATGYH